MDRLSINDIWDLREYERRRDDYRSWIIARKRNRRVSIGDFITVVFENRDTVKFQIQEMVRAERMLRDDEVQGELDAYNPLIPGNNELSATLFLEFSGEIPMREWLPKLVGIEKAVQLQIGDRVVPCRPEQEHEDMLTRSDVTSSVHYIRFPMESEDVAAMRESTVVLAVDHPAYKAGAPLTAEMVEELLNDLEDGAHS